MIEQEMTRRVTIHRTAGDVPTGAPGDAVAVGFARKMQHFMVQKGWSQRELAENASLHLAPGTPVVSASNISKYINAREMPTPVKLKAIADALGVTPEDLVDTDAVNAVGRQSARVSLQDLGDGRVWLRINQPVNWAVAIKVLDLIKGEVEE